MGSVANYFKHEKKNCMPCNFSPQRATHDARDARVATPIDWHAATHDANFHASESTTFKRSGARARRVQSYSALAERALQGILVEPRFQSSRGTRWPSMLRTSQSSLNRAIPCSGAYARFARFGLVGTILATRVARVARRVCCRGRLRVEKKKSGHYTSWVQRRFLELGSVPN